MKCPHCNHKLDPIEPGTIRCHKCGNPVDVEPKDIKKECVEKLRITFVVNNFSYNGIYGYHLPGKAPYTATFIEWTNDPGIGRFQCSDGKERLIPTFALEGDRNGLPPQSYKDKVYFGESSHS